MQYIEIRCFSGYIRNWKKLCGELNIDPTLSRAEREEALLIAAYQKWQMKMMEHLYGMFAFAVWDANAQKLFVVRDQVGQKQMFYTVAGGELLCSGDINELVADARVEKHLNKRMLQQYLFYGYPIGAETFYEGVYKLQPGHYVEWDGKTAAVHRYFRPVFEPDHTKSAEEFSEEIKAVVEEILGEERGDTALPYKESFLSGGVDSSYLLAASDAQAANTVGYEESGFDESALARQTAEALNKPINIKIITPQEYFDRIPTVMEKMGQPLGDASAVAFSLGCAAVREHAEVVYSGEGIDEFFGGYNAHKRELPSDWTYLTCSHIMSEEVVKSLMKDYSADVRAVDPVAPLWKEVQGQHPLAQKLTIDISLWLEGDIYLNTDRTSTACGVELHTPFSSPMKPRSAKRSVFRCRSAHGWLTSATTSPLPKSSSARPLSCSSTKKCCATCGIALSAASPCSGTACTPSTPSSSGTTSTLQQRDAAPVPPFLTFYWLERFINGGSELDDVQTFFLSRRVGI